MKQFNLRVPVKYEARFKNWTNSLLVEQVFTEFESYFFLHFQQFIVSRKFKGKVKKSLDLNS